MISNYIYVGTKNKEPLIGRSGAKRGVHSTWF